MKDLIVKLFKSILETILKLIIEAVKGINWKSVVYNSYISHKPELEKKVNDSASKVDDGVIKALDIIVDKFLKPGEKDAN